MTELAHQNVSGRGSHGSDHVRGWEERCQANCSGSVSANNVSNKLESNGVSNVSDVGSVGMVGRVSG